MDAYTRSMRQKGLIIGKLGEEEMREKMADKKGLKRGWRNYFGQGVLTLKTGTEIREQKGGVRRNEAAVLAELEEESGLGAELDRTRDSAWECWERPVCPRVMSPGYVPGLLRVTVCPRAPRAPGSLDVIEGITFTLQYWWFQSMHREGSWMGGNSSFLSWGVGLPAARLVHSLTGAFISENCVPISIRW